MYLGFVALGSAIPIPMLVKNPSTGAPAAADSSPTFRIYGPSGLMTGGTGTLSALDVTGLYSGSRHAAAGNGYVQGQTYSILVRTAVSSANIGDLHTFTVV